LRWVENKKANKNGSKKKSYEFRFSHYYVFSDCVLNQN